MFIMTLIIMLGLYNIVVTKVEQQLLPNRPEKRATWLQYLLNLSLSRSFFKRILCMSESNQGKFCLHCIVMLGICWLQTEFKISLKLFYAEFMSIQSMHSCQFMLLNLLFISRQFAFL